MALKMVHVGPLLHIIPISSILYFFAIFSIQFPRILTFGVFVCKMLRVKMYQYWPTFCYSPCIKMPLDFIYCEVLDHVYQSIWLNIYISVTWKQKTFRENVFNISSKYRFFFRFFLFPIFRQLRVNVIFWVIFTYSQKQKGILKFQRF